MKKAGQKFTAESARAAALARWARTSPEEASLQARAMAAARWESATTAEAVAERKALHADRAERRRQPCLNCGDPVGRANASCCGKPECVRVRRARATASRRARDGREDYGYTDAAAAAYHRRRALKLGATIEKFTNSEIFHRDGWTCGICSLPVDPALKFPDLMSASLDHIVPLALGGEHSRANTQCAHLTCNVRKGARVA